VPRLTDKSIKAAGEGIIWDDLTRGLGIRVGKTKKTFVVLVDSGRRKSIGHYPTLSLADARKIAKEMLAEKMLGKVRPKHVAFDDAKADFLTECALKNRASTVSDYTKILRKHYPFGRKGVGDITPRDILGQLAVLNDKPTRKRYAFAVGRVFFNWCIKQHIIDRSPLENLATPTIPSPRQRVLTTEELAAVYHTAMRLTTPFHCIVALLLLTGQRRGEISHLEWAWVGEDSILLPSDITKNKRPHAVPFGEVTRQVFDEIPRYEGCPYTFPAARKRSEDTTVFNGWGKPKAKFDTESKVSFWKLHDLRRTYSSFMASMGVDQVVVEKNLNHVSGGTQSPISQVYNRYDYWEQRVNAVLLWEDYLNNLKNPSL
jgi:integrase